MRPVHYGACSTRRGHWDRSTDTWVSELTDDDRRMIKRALVRYIKRGESRESVISWVQTHPGYEKTSPSTLNSWYMVYLKHKKRGTKWPI